MVELYAEWSEDEKFKNLVDANRSKLEGIRILKPGVLEAFVSNIAFYYGEPKYVKSKFNCSKRIMCVFSLLG